MSIQQTPHPPGQTDGDERILLLLLPFWMPQIPPMGIAGLKGFLARHGHHVTAMDANIDGEFNHIYYQYFDILKKYIPKEQQGNLSALGNCLLEKHLMAHLHYDDEARYIELVRLMIKQDFLCTFQDDWVRRLNELPARFFPLLDRFVLDLLEKERPTILGFSTFSGTLPASIRAMKLAKDYDPGIKTVMGGGIFTGQLAVGSEDMEFFLEKTGDFIDHMIVGEGERLFLQLVRGQLPPEQKIYTMANQGIEPLDLEDGNLPDFSDFELGYYPYIGASGARGCPFNCKFCNATSTWGPYRRKSARRTAEEMRHTSQQYNHQLFLFTDSLLNPIIDPLARELAGSGHSIYWEGCLRVAEEVCDTGNTFFWRRAGFYQARLGVESGSMRMLKKMGKGIDVEMTRRAIYSLAQVGIKTTTYWVVGYPGETEEDFQLTLKLMDEMKENIYEAECAPFTMFPNSAVFKDEALHQNKKVPAFPSWSRPLLLGREYLLDLEPRRPESISRVQRFVQHRKKLGIPNPYTLEEVNLADERWLKLHQNSVPPVLAFKDKHRRITENLEVKKLTHAIPSIPDDDDWL